MDSESSRYLQDYYDSQNTFSYLNTKQYFDDLNNLLDDPTEVKGKELKTKIVKTLENDIKKMEKQMDKSESKKIKDFFKLMILKVIREFF